MIERRNLHLTLKTQVNYTCGFSACHSPVIQRRLKEVDGVSILTYGIEAPPIRHIYANADSTHSTNHLLLSFIFE
jgi:hypothetical protein